VNKLVPCAYSFIVALCKFGVYDYNYDHRIKLPSHRQNRTSTYLKLVKRKESENKFLQNS